MKKSALIAFVFLIGVSFAVIGFAEETAKKEFLYKGIVHKVNPKSKVVEVRKENMDVGMSFDASKAKFVNYKDLGSVKVGDRVTIGYGAEKGKMIAVTIAKEK